MVDQSFIERLIGDLEYGCGVKFGDFRPAALRIAMIYTQEAMRDQRHACAEAVLGIIGPNVNAHQAVMNTPTPKIGRH